MGETNTGEEEVKTTTDAEGDKGADDTQDESQNDGGADDKGASDDDNDAGAGDGADDKGGGDDADKSDKKDKSTEKKPTQNADEEPPARKRNADFIIARKNAKIAKLKDKDGKGADKKAGEDDDGDDVAPEDEELITKVVQKHLKPLAEKQAREEDNQEIDTFLADNPDFKPYADKVRKWAQHPSRAGIPIKSLFYEVAGDDLMKIGASRAKKADDEAKKTNAGGGANRGGEGGGKSVWDLSPEEFEAEQNKVRTKQAS